MANEISTEIRLVMPYPLTSGNNAVRHGKFGSYKIKEADHYDILVARRLVEHGMHGRLLEGPLDVEFHAWEPDRRARDDDNVLKVLKDALTKGRFWVDDSNRVIRRSSFEWHGVSEEAPGGTILVTVRKHRESQC